MNGDEKLREKALKVAHAIAKLLREEFGATFSNVDVLVQ